VTSFTIAVEEMPSSISEKTVGRLSLYRRLLDNLLAEKKYNVYSHELAKLAKVTAAQVRRDVMGLGYSGSPVHGYDVRELVKCISRLLDPATRQSVGLVGVGNLGRALLAYFSGRRPNLSIVAAFDRDPVKANRVINGCMCYPVELMSEVVEKHNIEIGIIAVPAADAQGIAEACIKAGMKGLLNFAPTPLHLPAGVHAADIDLAIALEKVAFFTRQGR
jgi:redox-sensing transcriptional repressor